MLYLFIQLVQGINIAFEQSQSSISIIENIVDAQICTGYFKPNGGYNCTFQVSIKHSQSLKKYYHTNELEVGIETWFSFNIIHACDLIVEIKPIPIDYKKQVTVGKIEYSFDSEIDGFNKEVAKEKVRGPAVQALKNLERMLDELALETDRRSILLEKTHLEYKNAIRFITIFSICAAFIAIFVNFYEVYSIRKFYKRKKLI